MNKYIYTFILGILLVAISACTKGRDDVFDPLPPIEIGEIQSSIPTQIFYGDTLRITPTITYGDEGAEAFDFHWYRVNGNAMKLLSTSPSLVQKMDSLGAWTIYLEVTNKQTKVSDFTTIYTSVLSQTQRGWYVLKENEEGNTDMDFFGVTSQGKDSTKMFNLLKQEDITFKGKPVGLYYVSAFNWKNPGTNSFSNYNALIPVSEQDLGAFRTDEGNFMVTTPQMFFDNSDKVSTLSGALSNSDQMLLVNGGRLYLMPTTMQAFLPEVIGDYSLSPWFTLSDVSGTPALGFDEKNHSFVSISKMTNSLSTFPDKYLKTKISSNRMNGNISFMENMNGNLNPDTVYSQRAYALFNESNRSDRCILLGLDLAQIDASQTKFGNFQFSPIMQADTISFNRIPSLKGTPLLALHKTAPNLYIANGNTISRYDVENHSYKAQIKTFPTDETITYMHYLVNQYDSSGLLFEDLIIATYKSDGTYCIYRFKVAGDSLTQEGNVYSGKGKVKTLVYASPNSYYLNYNLYRYY